MAPGSSIMPGKVNPIIPEVVNQVAFAICGNDLTAIMAAEHGQLQLNVMEPVIVSSIFQSIDMLTRALHTLRTRCVDGITANREHCAALVHNSIGIVTVLLPEIGYKNASRCAKQALQENRSVASIVLESGLMSKEALDLVMQPANMVGKAFTNEVKVNVDGEKVGINVDLQSGHAYGTYVPGGPPKRDVAWVQPGTKMPAPGGFR
jgi:aspartate ammonia-lyase